MMNEYLDFERIYLFCYKNIYREGEAVIGNIEYISKISGYSTSTVSRCINNPTNSTYTKVLGINFYPDIIKRHVQHDLDGVSILEIIETKGRVLNV